PFRTDDWPLVSRQYSGRESSYEKPIKPKDYVPKDWPRPPMRLGASRRTQPAYQSNILFIFSNDQALRNAQSRVMTAQPAS
ncbi:MAG: hypothetical protein OER86_04085, partial [Phycisphaerae bacterium]|nr:hypothetical protein [Phycisphaerae bacterium]